MPFEHGTYFSEREAYKAKEYLSTLGLSSKQAAEIQAWHQYHLGRQLTVWASLGTCTGIGLGYLFAQIF
ncbi:hypothetical protein KUW17_08385 [Leisingera aquaemixtae]|uniref:hypothetical protein n=1 Tax=Leisingera aquaemixtae TaxID=1396826 RepID=UPI001C9403DA|nr:hypothetical protein [Leisingera aquaemixtae]MBY6066754.1 hypothetical protein [Leisingera aquaemixtae]